jgi:cytoskeletal protein CcmA (bactofilin family)
LERTFDTLARAHILACVAGERRRANQHSTIKSPNTMPDITSTTKNILSSDVEIKGSIKFQNELTVDGKIEGEINSTGILTVGENAEMKGEIKTKSVTVLGKVHGNITVEERCELKSHAVLYGDLKAARLVIEDGATFVGKSEVTPNKVAMRQPEIVRAERTGTGGAQR